MFKELFESIPKDVWKKAIDKTEIEAEEMVYKDWKEFDGKVINNGFCDIFADNLESLLSGTTRWTTYASDGSGTFGHIWIEYKGRYYDAETPKGVKDMFDLPYLKRAKRYLKEKPKVEKI